MIKAESAHTNEFDEVGRPAVGLMEAVLREK
jgi:hypothetical protein